MEVHIIASVIASWSESRVLASHYNHCREWFNTAPAVQRQMLTRYPRVGIFGAFLILVLQWYDERLHRFGTRISLSDAHDAIMIRFDLSIS